MRRVARDGGFTLIEVMAAVAIFALLIGLVVPRIAAITSRSLRHRAEDIAGRIELARQRTVVTGVRHRLVVDLDRGAYWVEWEGPAEGPEAGPEPDGLPAAPPALDVRGETPIPELPPDEAEAEYRPLAGRFGDVEALEEGLSIAGVQTARGWVDRGEAWIEFERDGTAAFTEIHLGDDSGRGLVIEVPALEGMVGIGDVAG